MTQFSDGIRVGTAGTQQGTGTIRNVPHAVANYGSGYVNQNGDGGIEPGIPVRPGPSLAISPVTSFTNNLATSQTVGAGNFFTLTAGTGITSTTT